MSKISHFEELKCWQESRILVRLTYELINNNKQLKGDFDTSSQIRRAAVSVMNNIAEGFGRYYTTEMIRFLNIAQSSSLEVKSMTYVLEDNFAEIEKSKILELRDRSECTKRLILAFIKYLGSESNSKKRISSR